MSVRIAMIAVVALACLTGCSNVERSLIFFTNTTIGAEISAGEPGTPIEGVVGFKRAEGVINPVYDKKGITTECTSTECTAVQCAPFNCTMDTKTNTRKLTTKKYRDEAYSVLATIRGKGSAGSKGTSAKIGGGQWFATGEAARILARQPGIAGAISGSPDIAEAAARVRRISPSGDQRIELLTVQHAKKALDDSATKGSIEARYLNDQLNEAAVSFSGMMQFNKREYDRADYTLDRKEQVGETTDFDSVTEYWGKLNRSIQDMSEYREHWNRTPKNEPRPSTYDSDMETLAYQVQLRTSFVKHWDDPFVQLLKWYITYLTERN